MYVRRKVYSKVQEEKTYSVLMTQEEYDLFSEFQKEFTKHNLNAKQLQAWAKANPGVQLPSDTKEANKIVREHTKAQAPGTTTKQAFQESKAQVAAENVSTRDAQTVAKNQAAGRQGMAVEQAKHATNPQAEMAQQQKISTEVGKTTGAQVKAETKAASFDKNLQARQQANAQHNAGQGVRQANANAKHTSNMSAEEAKAAYEKRVAAKKAQRQAKQAQGPKAPLSLKRQAKQAGAAQQQTATGIVKQAQAAGKTEAEALKQISTPKAQEAIKASVKPVRNTPKPQAVEGFGQKALKFARKNKKSLAVGAAAGAALGAAYGAKKALDNKKEAAFSDKKGADLKLGDKVGIWTAKHLQTKKDREAMIDAYDTDNGHKASGHKLGKQSAKYAGATGAVIGGLIGGVAGGKKGAALGAAGYGAAGAAAGYAGTRLGVAGNKLLRKASRDVDDRSQRVADRNKVANGDMTKEQYAKKHNSGK